jgi:hypothetical protein
MRNFLVVYNRRTGENSVQEFPEGSAREAIRERFVRERLYRHDSDIEVVVLGSTTREELEKTHSRYFHSVTDLLRSASPAS